MFFGKSKPGGAEEVKSDALSALLNSLFEKKLDTFGARAKKITSDLQKARSAFAKACDDLERLDAEPYVQNIYFTNVSSIKNQKRPYAKTLRHIIDSNTLEPGDAQNSYERYRQVLSKVEEMKNEVLKTNANFKLILYCYANHMKGFKQSFSEIERSAEALSREIESRSKESSEFNSLSDWISRLNLQLEAQEAMGRNIGMLRESLSATSKGTLEKEEADVLKRLSETRSGLLATESEAGKLSDRISLLTARLERPARKMDHLSMRKRQLHLLMADPVGNIRTEAEYGEFRDMVKELKESVEKGAIEAKNKDGTLDSITALINADLYGMLQSLRSWQRKRLEAEYEIKALEITLGDVRKGRGSSEKAIQDIAAMEEKLGETRKAIDSAKHTIEKTFLDYYRKQISVIP